ncbi:hypothetical protein V2J09_004022 [Rumex salicifolius]
MNREAIIQWPNALVRVRGGSHADPPLFTTCSAQEPQTSSFRPTGDMRDRLQLHLISFRTSLSSGTETRLETSKIRRIELLPNLRGFKFNWVMVLPTILYNIIHSLKKTLSKFSVMRRCFGDRNPSSFGSKVAIVTPLSSMPPRLSSANVIRLKCCQNDQGNWVEKGEDIKRMIVDF